MENMDQIIEMSQGNPGALAFLVELIKTNQIMAIAKLYGLGIRGTDLYILWSDLCGRDLFKTLKLIQDCPPDILKDACSRQDRSGVSLVQPYSNV